MFTCTCSSVDRAVVSGTMCGGSIPFRCAAWDVCTRSGALYHKEDKNLDDFREWLSDNLRYFMLGGAILLIVGSFGSLESVPVSEGKKGTDSGAGRSADQHRRMTREMFLLLRQMKGSLTRRKKTPIPWKQLMQRLLH